MRLFIFRCERSSVEHIGIVWPEDGHFMNSSILLTCINTVRQFFYGPHKTTNILPLMTWVVLSQSLVLCTIRRDCEKVAPTQGVLRL